MAKSEKSKIKTKFGLIACFGLWIAVAFVGAGAFYAFEYEAEQASARENSNQYDRAGLTITEDGPTTILPPPPPGLNPGSVGIADMPPPSALGPSAPDKAAPPPPKSTGTTPPAASTPLSGVNDSGEGVL